MKILVTRGDGNVLRLTLIDRERMVCHTITPAATRFEIGSVGEGPHPRASRRHQLLMCGPDGETTLFEHDSLRRVERVMRDLVANTERALGVRRYWRIAAGALLVVGATFTGLMLLGTAELQARAEAAAAQQEQSQVGATDAAPAVPAAAQPASKLVEQLAARQEAPPSPVETELGITPGLLDTLRAEGVPEPLIERFVAQRRTLLSGLGEVPAPTEQRPTEPQRPPADPQAAADAATEAMLGMAQGALASLRDDGASQDQIDAYVERRRAVWARLGELQQGAAPAAPPPGAAPPSAAELLGLTPQTSVGSEDPSEQILALLFGKEQLEACPR